MPFLVLALSAATLTGCGEATLYPVEIETELVDEAGQALRELGFETCSAAVFEEAGLVEGRCDSATSDEQGLGLTSDFYTDTDTLTDIQLTANIAGTELQGEVLSVLVGDSEPDVLPIERRVQVQSRFVVPDALVPVYVTRLDVFGQVNGGRDGGIPNQSGTLTVEVSLDGGETVLTSASGPVSTDGSAAYTAQIDLSSHFWFQVSDETLTTRIEIDGYQGEGFLQINSVEGDDPRTVDAFLDF